MQARAQVRTCTVLFPLCFYFFGTIHFLKQGRAGVLRNIAGIIVTEGIELIPYLITQGIVC